MPIPHILTEDYNYSLPQEKIAQHPLEERDASKLLLCKEGIYSTDIYKHLATHLPTNSLIVFNNSKVIPARILYVKETFGIIELFCLEPIKGTPYEALQQQGRSRWTCLIGGLKKWKKETVLQWQLEGSKNVVEATFIQQNENGFEIEFSWTEDTKTFAEVLEVLGQMPIPPYLLRKAEENDATRYQTVYAAVEGSVAAPTAGLHFTAGILNDLQQKNITQAYTTLHVGAGTFKPVTALYAHEHSMHAEWIEVNKSLIEQLIKFHKITCVGTTSLRTIESLYWYAVTCFERNTIQSSDYILPQFIPYEHDKPPSTNIVFSHLLELLNNNHADSILFKTELMILPGYSMKVATHLITNFHQPKSTLLMLVDACTHGRWKDMYQYALENDYRFLSYGDGCLLAL